MCTPMCAAGAINHCGTLPRRAWRLCNVLGVCDEAVFDVRSDMYRLVLSRHCRVSPRIDVYFVVWTPGSGRR